MICISILSALVSEGSSEASQIKLYPIPQEVSSSHFRVKVNGHGTNVLHAASSYYMLNFDVEGPVTLSITSDDPHFWDKGVEIQPMRLGIRPTRSGATITFQIRGPEKLTIARPGDHFADAEMLFLFANPIEYSRITSSTPSVRYYGAGVHHENIDAHTGDTIYLDGGAVVFGSLNIWKVRDVRVLGRGTIIYDGTQNPFSDEGWMNKPNWHAIVMNNAENIEIDGIVCITRSRSWQIQMRDSRHIGFYNIKVIGGNPHDANQDGMDWLGGGDTRVANSFFRASDDVFALQGNWEGYELEKLRTPGHDVTNITIEDTIASTSISNTIRVGWPQKIFNSAHFSMSDVDVIHTGYGGCKVPFAFFELWADPDGKGSHTDYSFKNIRLEDWYSLLQIRQPLPQVRAISFSGIWSMDGAAMVPSVLKGNVSGVDLNHVSLQGIQGEAVRLKDGASEPKVESEQDAEFTYTLGLLEPRHTVDFVAQQPAIQGRRFEWIFGDGARAIGPQVRHSFPDDMGTLLDGSGRFRVLLHITDPDGQQSWNSQSVVMKQRLLEAYPVDSTTIDETPSDLATEDHLITIPISGGYTFTLLTSRSGFLQIDDLPGVPTAKPRPQVCGSRGDAVQPVRASAALAAGNHRIRVRLNSAIENAESPSGDATGTAVLLWEGPGLPRQTVR